MLSKSFIFTLAVAAATFSSTASAFSTGRPSSLNLLSKRSSFECPGSAPSCLSCQTQENRCLGEAAGPVSEEVRSCIAQAQECYSKAENEDIYGRYSCDSAYATCIADGGGEGFCQTQLDGCGACETRYDRCRNCPACVNSVECQDASVQCFFQAVTLNGTVTPRSPSNS